MPIDTLPPLSELHPWILANDEHASHRLPLLSQAEQVLRGEQDATTAERLALASKLERWRYQYLNERSEYFAPMDWRLVDALDLAGNALARRPVRRPRGVYHAIHRSAAESDGLDEALAALDPSVPLDDLSRRAEQLTSEHFSVIESGPGGSTVRKRRVLMYAPLYVANQCANHCTYCGFSYPLEITRRQLNRPEALQQAQLLLDRGFRHLLLVAGDFPSLTTTAYFIEIIEALRALQVRPSIEIAAQPTDAYAALVAAGVCGLTLYQETYNEELYRLYHIRGPKTSYFWRLEAMDRAAEAGMPRLGLGVLLGLGDPREEIQALLRHGRDLSERFPGLTLAFSLPRIHDAPTGFDIPYPVDDETFCRLYCLLRLAFPQAELVLSTREPPALRNRLASLCITQMSAGSSTAPGGYGEDVPTAGEQFPISDHRSPEEVVQWLASAGLLPRWDVPPVA